MGFKVLPVWGGVFCQTRLQLKLCGCKPRKLGVHVICANQGHFLYNPQRPFRMSISRTSCREVSNAIYIYIVPQGPKYLIINNHIVIPNLYYNYHYPKPKHLIIGHLDPEGFITSAAALTATQCRSLTQRFAAAEPSQIQHQAARSCKQGWQPTLRFRSFRVYTVQGVAFRIWGG